VEIIGDYSSPINRQIIARLFYKNNIFAIIWQLRGNNVTAFDE